MVHRIHPGLLRGPVHVLVVGCGGTGAAFASGLPYLDETMRALGHPGGLKVTVADGDIVSPTNRGRQPFNDHHVGRNKAEVLVTGLNNYWSLAWRAVPHHITARDSLDGFDIVVGCVDKRAARAVLAALVRRTSSVRYWIDAGNGPDWGQIILGEPRERAGHLRLPMVDELLPESVRPGPEDEGPSCSQLEALTRQAPFTNHVMSDNMLFLLGQLFRRGELQHHGLFVNLAEGTTAPLPVDPEEWKRMQAVPVPAVRGTTTRKSSRPRRRPQARAA